ncbi:MAG: lipase maturation factor family protein [Archangium sp.]
MRRLFFICFGLVVMIAVGSYWWQFGGLAGVNGIAPMGEAFDRASAQLTIFELPTLLWFSSSDVMIHLLLALSFFSGVAMVFGVAPRSSSITLWACWGSLVQVGHPFLSFQWDILLVEAAFCSAFYAPGGVRPRFDQPAPSAFAFVMYALACKVTLQSGIVKLTSGDPSWRDLTALTYHWWTQPLPTWTSFLIAELPLFIQQAMCALMFVFELLIPLLAFGPRKLRGVAAAGLIVLQAALFVAGNYSYYNVLALVLAVPLLGETSSTSRWRWAVPVLYVAISIGMFTRAEWVKPLRRFDTINAYGAFAWMTKSRAEIILEGSNDGVTWTAYEFPWKPGDVTRRPDFIAPWQPRLDWQMWFASLGRCGGNPWILSMQQKVLTGEPTVLALFETNPFPASPPEFLRTRSFAYRFAPLSQKSVWWTRTEAGPYCPTLRLDENARLMRAD